jgi:hypothetical protein
MNPTPSVGESTVHRFPRAVVGALLAAGLMPASQPAPGDAARSGRAPGTRDDHTSGPRDSARGQAPETRSILMAPPPSRVMAR